MKARIALMVLFLFVSLASSVSAAEPQKRVLSGIELTGGDSFTDVKISLENNAYQALGDLATQKYVIDAILENTDLKDGKSISVSPRGSKLINSITAVQSGTSKVKLRLHFKELIKNINEGLKIEQGAAEITLRLDQAVIMAAVADRKAGRPTAAERKAREEKKNSATPAGAPETPKSETAQTEQEKADVNEAADVAPDNTEAAATAGALPEGDVNAEKKNDGDAPDDSEMAQAAKGILDELKKNSGSEPVDFNEKKDKTLLNLFGVTTAGNDPTLTEVPDIDAEVEKEEASLAGVGNHLPDLTSLYWMAGLVFLLAAAWFLYRKISSGGKIIPNLNLDKPLKVLSTQKIDDNQNLMMVETDGRRFLISSNGSDTRLLAQLDDQQSEDSDLSKLIPDMSQSLPAAKSEEKPFKKTALKIEQSNEKSRRTKEGVRPSFFGGKADGSGSSGGESVGKVKANDAEIHKGQSIPGMAQRLKDLRKRLD